MNEKLGDAAKSSAILIACQGKHSSMQRFRHCKSSVIGTSTPPRINHRESLAGRGGS